MARLGIAFGSGWLSLLTLLFTCSKAYHVFWETDDYIYDMHLIRRRRPRGSIKADKIDYYDFPFVTQCYLELQLTNDNTPYGVLDYLLFGIRPIYHLFGKSTRNTHGTICSEMMNYDLKTCGYTTPWALTAEPPSPADFDKWLKSKTLRPVWMR